MDSENDGEEQNNTSSSGGGLIGLVIVIALCWWGYNQFLKKDYSKPWWTGTETQKVCSTDGNETCYSLAAYSDGEVIDTVSFPNGGYLTGESECFEAASIYDYDQFCRFYDQEGRKWDVIPLQ